MAASVGALRPQHNPGLPLAHVLPTASDAVITGVSLDSRHVEPGDLYVGLAGTSTHGARYARQAQDAGAVAVLTDAIGRDLCADLTIPVIVVDDPRAVTAAVAAKVYGRPSERVTMLGVTGTNGKTSTTFLLAAALGALGQVPGTIGTLGFRVGDRALVGSRTTITTPESPDLQALLAVMVESGVDAVAMEVSSHALALGRVDQIVFDVAGFTQLGQDHLDFHPSLEDYFLTKSRLFLGGHARQVVINIDDAAGRRLVDLVTAEGQARVWTTSMEREADYRALSWRTMDNGTTRVEAMTPQGALTFDVGMLGAFNVHNALTALAMIAAAGGDVRRAAAGFAHAAVPGRMQRVDLGPDAPLVIVDFAHTPQAVAAALDAMPAGRRIVVFGCGGDRDATKREPMGRAAAEGADIVIVTDDNPRSEDPASIRAAVLAGAHAVTDGRATLVIDGTDRRTAIAEALRIGRPGDTIAVLGKGHESGQDIKGVISPFDDVSVIRHEWFARKGS